VSRGGRALSRYVPPSAAIGLLLLSAALFLPWNALLEWGVSRFNTVRAYRPEYARGLEWLRLALAANAALAFAWIRLSRLLWPPSSTPAPRPHDRADLRIMGGLFALALVLRLIGITGSLQHDEWYIASNYVQHGPLIIATRYTGFTNHVLYTLMAWAGTKVFGMNEIGLRAAAVLFGALAPAAFYGALRCRFSRLPSLVGGAVLSLSALALSYSQEARGYSVALFCIAALLWLHEEVRERPSRRVFLLTVIVSASIIYDRLVYVIVPTAFLAAAAFQALIRGRENFPFLRRCLRVYLVTGLVSFLLYAVTFGTLLGVLKTGRPEPGEIQTYQSAAVLLPSDLTVAFAPAWVVAAAWAVAVGGLVVLAFRGSFWFLSAAAITVISLNRFGLSMDNSRYQIHVLPLVILAQAAALAWLLERGRAGRGIAIALAVALVSAHAVSAARYHSKDKLDFKAAAAHLAAQPGSGRVGYAHDSKTVAWYLRRPGRAIEVNAGNLDAEDPEWVSIHTVTLAGEGRFAAAIYRRYEEVWRKASMFGHSLTLWHRVEPPFEGK